MGLFRSVKTKNDDLKQPLTLELEEFNPKSYNEIVPIANTLVLQKPIKLNLQSTEVNDRKRIIDFLCGIAFVLDLNVEKVEQHTYKFTSK